MNAGILVLHPMKGKVLFDSPLKKGLNKYVFPGAWSL